ncbi:MAG: MlaD family protein [Pseudomonadota bacterium]|nr:MlaD family protein [Pseudomonadota bacterium]
MSEQRQDVGELPAAVPARTLWGRLPLVWILPAVVVLVGGFVVIREKLNQGTSIEIRFANAEGLEANKTRVRYKDVEIGEVTDTRVSDDRKEVIVTADIHRNARSYLVDDTRFWVVRPRISGAGVSGLATLVSGAYISVDVGHSEVRRDHFVGLEIPPIVTAGLPGAEFALHADDLGSLDIGSAVFYRHITAGQVVGYTLDPGGTGVTIQVFIKAPFDTYVTSATRFWQASGIDMSVNAQGVKLHTESLASILEGGVAFGALPGAPIARVAPNTVFALYEDQDRAMRPSETEIRGFVMYFGGSVRGLSAGAPVELHGITVGEVKSVDVEYDQGAGSLAFPVVVELYPQRLRGRMQRLGRAAPAPEPSESASRAMIDNLVSHGLRAELKTGNLLTGQKFVALDMHQDASKDRVGWMEQPAIFPTISSGLDDIQDSVGVIAKKLSKVPFDRLSARLMTAMDSLDHTLKSADHLLQNVDSNLAPQVRATLAEAQGALKNAKELLGKDAPLENDLGSTLLQVSRAAKSISALVDYLERHPESLLRGKPAGAQ